MRRYVLHSLFIWNLRCHTPRLVQPRRLHEFTVPCLLQARPHKSKCLLVFVEPRLTFWNYTCWVHDNRLAHLLDQESTVSERRSQRNSSTCISLFHFTLSHHAYTIPDRGLRASGNSGKQWSYNHRYCSRRRGGNTLRMPAPLVLLSPQRLHQVSFSTRGIGNTPIATRPGDPRWRASRSSHARWFQSWRRGSSRWHGLWHRSAHPGRP